jgi:glycine/D-amino acid oxidase-like deaminating enzyme
MKSATSYGRSPWRDQYPRSRRPAYPKARGALQSQVVIVGGGLTGCATAYAFASAGVDVTLLEADQIGCGSSGASAGWIADDPGVPFLDIEKALGRRAARHTWKTWRRGALDFIALLRKLQIRCELEPRGHLLIASTPEQTSALRREHKARRGAGIDAAFVTPKAVLEQAGMQGTGALRSRDGATLDPYRALVGLGAEAVKRGARIFERSSVRKIAFDRKSVDAKTSDATIHADYVVVATGLPTSLFATLARHFWFRSAFLALTQPIPSKVRQQLGYRALLLRDSAVPSHLVRWTKDERLLIAGADMETVPAREKDKTIVQRTGQLMYELSTLYPDISGILPAYGWDAPYARTADGLPYIGPHRNYPRHLFAFNDASRNVTAAYLAARLLLREYLDEADRADAAFGFNRYGHVR